MRFDPSPDLAMAAVLSLALMPMAAAATPIGQPLSLCMPMRSKDAPQRNPQPMTPCHACLLCSKRIRAGKDDEGGDDAG